MKELYELGGRTFLVLNLAPVGCYPAILVELKHNSSDIDEFGCLVSYNKAVMDYNTMLKNELSKTGKLLLNASVIYVNTHDVLLELFQHPTIHGIAFSMNKIVVMFCYVMFFFFFFFVSGSWIFAIVHFLLA